MTVVFYGSVQDKTQGEKAVELEGAPTLRGLIDLLGDRFGPQFRQFLLADETCLLLVNGGGILTTGGLDTQLAPGDKVEVLPFVDGG